LFGGKYSKQMSAMTKKTCEALFICLSTWALAGCAGLPLAERQSNATTEVSEKWSRDQKERFKVAVGALQSHPQGGSVEVSVDNSESGNGDQSLLGGIENSIPGGIKLVYLGLGILVVLFAVKKVSQSSSAVRAISSAADEAIAKQVRKLEGRLAGTTDDKQRSELLALLTELERERGKLKT
jgi:hypothetical protein